MADWMSKLTAEEVTGFTRWKDHQEQVVLPAMEDSAVVVSLAPPGAADAKFCVELGFAIMLGKPVIVVARPGAELPGKLLAVADEVIRADLKDEASSRAAGKKIAAAMARLAKEHPRG